MGELRISNIKRPENLVKLLIVCLSLIGFSLLLVGLKCLNNNVHIQDNYAYNRLVASSYSLFLEPTDEVEQIESNNQELNAQTFAPYDIRPPKRTKAEAHHIFECALYKYKIKHSELFLLLVNFMCFFITTLTLITCLISEGFTKNFEVIFHIISFLLYFCTSIFVLVEETEIAKSYESRKNIIASGVCITFNALRAIQREKDCCLTL